MLNTHDVSSYVLQICILVQTITRLFLWQTSCNHVEVSSNNWRIPHHCTPLQCNQVYCVCYSEGSCICNCTTGYIRFPLDNEIRAMVEGFETVWGCHSVLVPLMVLMCQYVDLKQTTPTTTIEKSGIQLVLQGVVDHKYRFPDVYIEWPGSVHDVRILAYSTLYNKAISGTLLSSCTGQITGESIPLFLLGDSAYPFMTWLMKPFPHYLLYYIPKICITCRHLDHH